MSVNTPKTLLPLITLAQQLRLHGFAVSPDQTMGFIESVGILGPRSIGDIRHAAIALFAIPPEREFEFDAIFQEVFYGTVVSAEAKGSDDDVDAHEDTGRVHSQEVQGESPSTGTDAVRAEQLSSREFSASDPALTLVNFEREAKKRLPRRISYRWQSASRGRKLDFRQSLKLAARYDGDVVGPSYLRRMRRQRKVVLLVDVSGSMKALTDHTLRFAHRLISVADQCEVFTLGTRLTRVTSALRIDDINMALLRVSELVADFDGGTRIGAALQAYLSIPRYAGFARGAMVVVLSDGLERGDPSELISAVRTFNRLCWRLQWLTPLATEGDFTPETEAMMAIMPFIDRFGSCHSIESTCSEVLAASTSLAKTA